MQSIADKVIDTLKEITGEEDLLWHTGIRIPEDVSIDSLDRIEIVMKLEESIGIDIDDIDLDMSGSVTVAEIIQVVEEQCAKAFLDSSMTEQIKKWNREIIEAFGQITELDEHSAIIARNAIRLRLYPRLDQLAVLYKPETASHFNERPSRLNEWEITFTPITTPPALVLAAMASAIGVA